MSNLSAAVPAPSNKSNVVSLLKNHPANPETDHIETLFGGTHVDCSEAISEYISGSDWRIKANANTGYSNAGLINNVAGKVIANFWLDEIYTPEEGKAHRNGDVHIHDLDCLTGYCAGWSLRTLLNDGFNGVGGRVSSRPPRHFREALGQMSNFLGILQSEWAGAQAFSSFDTYLAPYVFYDQLGFKEVKKPSVNLFIILMSPQDGGNHPSQILRWILLFLKICRNKRQPIKIFIFLKILKTMSCF